MADATQTRMLAADFLALPESSQPTELIDGEIVMTPAPRHTHQKLVYRLAKLIEHIAAGTGEVNISPQDVHLDENNVVQPDLFWISGPESRCQLGEDEYWHGAPDLVVEVLSPATARYDKVEKFRLYEKHGTREYWIVEPEAQYVEVWQLADGKFRSQGIFGSDESFQSVLLGEARVDLRPIFAA
jgi:Uma2 family endonuclease